MDNEGIAAILGLVIKTVGEVTIPREAIEEGLPENSGVRIEVDEESDSIVVKIVQVEA